MMEQFFDCRRRCVCFADAETGEVDVKYKGLSTITFIPIHGTYQLDRDDTVTILKRVSTTEFYVTSYRIA